MISNTIHIKARLTLYPTEKGGRTTGIGTGYRPNHVFEYKENSSAFVATYIGQIDFEQEWVLLNEPTLVDVRFHNHRNIADFIEIGRVWWIHEASRKIGEAEIIEIMTE